MSHGLMHEHPGPFGRIPRRLPGNHDWVSSDAKSIDCSATGCKWNVGKQCAVPSRCKIKADGGCAGFEAKPLPPERDGD